MMKISLDTEIAVTVEEHGKEKETLTVYYREYTKAEKRELEALWKQFQALVKKTGKLEKKRASLEKKADLSERMGDLEKAMRFVEQIEKIDAQIEKVAEEIEALGGDDFAETTAKKSFDLLVSGPDADRLRAYAEIKGYGPIMASLNAAKGDAEKKRSGESPNA